MRKVLIYFISVLSMILILTMSLYAAADVTIKLETNDGSSGLQVQDSLGVIVSTITSTGDAYFKKNVGIGTTNPGAALHLNKPWAGTSIILKMLNPSMPDAGALRYHLGKEAANYNCAEISYTHQADGSGNNYISLGLYGKSIAHFVGTGRVGIGETAPESAMEITSASPIITL
ncbi:MAG: hypothetical protein ABH857_05215, partial [Elusimicrobiota bacterium]